MYQKEKCHSDVLIMKFKKKKEYVKLQCYNYAKH